MTDRICDLCGSEYLGRRRCADPYCRRNHRRRRWLFEQQRLQRVAVHGVRTSTASANTAPASSSAASGSADPGFAFSGRRRTPPPRPPLGLPSDPPPRPSLVPPGELPGSRLPFSSETGSQSRIVHTPYGHPIRVRQPLTAPPGGQAAGTAGTPPPPASGTVADTGAAGVASRPSPFDVPSTRASGSGDSRLQAGYPGWDVVPDDWWRPPSRPGGPDPPVVAPASAAVVGMGAEPRPPPPTRPTPKSPPPVLPTWADVQRNTMVSDFVPLPENESAVSAILECAICLEPFVSSDKVRTLPCMHRFHMQCADRWLHGAVPPCALFADTRSL